MVGIAQTGTGKTAAFVLPLLHALSLHQDRPMAKSCRALILAPTRELASQIGACIRTYGRFTHPTFTVIVGGVSPGPQIKALARGVDIVVATPGRLLDHVGTGAMRLDGTKHVVLDEADQMMDLGFFPAIRRIMGMISIKRQTMLFSATMPAPIRALASDFLRTPKEVAVTPASRPIERIDQRVIRLDAASKGRTLIELIKGAEVGQTIVFTRTKRGADRVSLSLEGSGITSAAIHGNKSQGQRERALSSFRCGAIKVLVATDIAARGIDIDGVSHVINYELPNVPEAYVHRIGRTARAGASGSAISLCDSSERSLLRDIERLIGKALPSEGEWRPESANAVQQGRPGGGDRSGQRNGQRSNGGKPGGSQSGDRRPGNNAGRSGNPGNTHEIRVSKTQNGSKEKVQCRTVP